jgi:hypothetical protein
MVGMTRRQIKSSLTPLIAMIGPVFALVSFSANACGLRDIGASYFDDSTGIEIQKCNVGQTWTNNSCAGRYKQFNWEEAVTQHGKGEWRLPTKDEAESIKARTKSCMWLGENNWTSTPYSHRYYAWFAHFNNGYVGYYTKTNIPPVRLVRVGQPQSGVNAAASTAIIPQYAGPAPQSFRDCLQRHDVMQRGMSTQEQIDRTKLQLACIDEWERLKKSSPADSTAQSTNENASLQASAQQAQTRAREAQQRGDTDAQRKGRRTHDPAAEAHECIEVDTTSLYGGFKNKCSFPVSYGYCVENPKSGAWTDTPLFSCAGMQGKSTAGGGSMGPNGYDANHTKGGTAVHYFACRKPAGAYELTFDGSQIVGRCRTIGG